MYLESFQYAPYVLIFLMSLVIFFLVFERRRTKILFGFYPKSQLVQKLPHYQPYASFYRFVLFLLALALLGFAFLKPYSGFEMREVSRRGIDIYMLVDVSNSMLAEDIKPSRIVRARHEIKDFLSKLKGDRIGLIGFAGTSFVFVPLTSDYGAFTLFVDELNSEAIPQQGTDIKGAIEKALESFHKQSKASSKAIILITDGEDSVGLDDGMIDQIKKSGLKIFVIGVGSQEGAPIPLPAGGYKTDSLGEMVLTKLNEGALQNLALQTDGGYVRSVSGDLDLDQIYSRGIKKAFADEELAKTQKKLPQYWFQIPILLGVILLFLEILTTNKKRYWLSLFNRKKR